MNIKIYLFIATGLLLTSATKVFAAPAYGPKLPERGHFQFGLQSYSVLERKLDHDHGEMNSQQEFVLISYGITDWFSLDLKGGAGDIEQHPDIGTRLKYPTYLAGGYGFRLKLLEEGNTRGVFGFQHISVHPDSISVSGVKHKAVLDDWQFSLLVSHKLDMFDPYVGVRWSRMDYIHWADNRRKRIKSDLDKSTGLLAGFNIYLKENLWVNVEGNAFDTEALAASINFQY